MLLEHTIHASSNDDAAAQKLNREWIGIDITHLAVGLMKLRLKDSFGMLPAGTKAALPPDVQKSSAFPADAPQDSGGSAADPRHSLEDSKDDSTAKQSFAAHRQAEPEKKSGTF